jgi:hypothetical protein
MTTLTSEQRKILHVRSEEPYFYSADPLSTSRFCNDYTAAKKEPQRLSLAGQPAHVTCERMVNKEDGTWSTKISGGSRRLLKHHSEGKLLNIPYLLAGVEVRT